MRFVTTAADDSRRFWVLFLAAAAIKVLIAAALPLTGDEAYFALYARNPDWGGFYDHPPMVGWMLWLMGHAGSHEAILRLPAVALGLLLPLALYWCLRDVDERKARLVALLLLLTPIYLVGVLITTDTGLILFGFLSVVALYRAEAGGRRSAYALAGLLLGLAIYSKYFALLLAFSYVVYFLLRARHRWPGFLLLFAVAGVFVGLNLLWNYLNCWNHIMFNVVNRHPGNGSLDLRNLVVYVLMLGYLFALPAWFLLRDRDRVVGAVRSTPWLVFVIAGAVPLGVFLLLSPLRSIGLHWVLLFVPLLYVLYVFLPRRSLERSLAFMTVFAGLHLAVIASVLMYPPHWLEERDIHRDAVFYGDPRNVAQALEPFEADHYAIGSYARAGVLSHYTDEYWSVFGTGSQYAREDDRITDWTARDGDSVLVFGKRYPIRPEDVEPYFERVEYTELEVGGVPFQIALGRGFRYQVYHEEVLQDVRKLYYRIPEWLPVGGCRFLARYFGDMPENR